MKFQVLRNSTGAYGTITALAVDSRNLYVSDSNGGITAWEKPDFSSSRYLPGQTATQILTLHSDDQFLYSGSDSGDPVIRIYNQDLDLIEILKGHLGSIFDIKSDSKNLFTGSGDATVRIWEKGNWVSSKSITAQTHFVLTLEIDDKYIFAGGIDNCTNVLSRSTLRRITSLHGHEANVLSLAIDNDFVYSGSGELWWGGPGSPRPPVFESAVRVWDKKQWTCVKTLKGHNDNVNGIGVDQSFVYSVSDDGTLIVYSKSDWGKIFATDFNVGRLSTIIHDDTHIFVGCADGNIRILSKEQFNL